MLWKLANKALLLLTAFSAAGVGAQLPASSGEKAPEILIEDRVSQAQAKSAALQPKDREAVKALFSSAFQLWKSGNFKAARLGFEDGLARDPANGMAHFYLAETLVRLNDRRAARAHYEMAAALVPTTQEGLKARTAMAALRPAAIIAIVIPDDAPNYRATISTPWTECSSRNVEIGATLKTKLASALSEKPPSVSISSDFETAKAAAHDRIIVVSWSDFSADMESKAKGTIAFEIRLAVHGGEARPSPRSYPYKSEFDWQWGAFSNANCADFRRDSTRAAEEHVVRAAALAIRSAMTDDLRQ